MVKETKYYNLLGVKSDASEREIKRAYRKLSLVHHPDRPNGNADKFKEISEAYEVLKDPEKREMYDRFGEGMESDDPFEMMRRHHQQQQKPVLRHFHHLTLEELYAGCQITLEVCRKNICSDCSGKGSKSGRTYKCDVCRGTGVQTIVRQMGPMIQQMQRQCDACQGKGNTLNKDDMCIVCCGQKVVDSQYILEVNVPAGYDTDDPMVYRDEGDEDPDTGERGHLLVCVEEKPHDVFKRVGPHLKAHINVDLWQTLYGGQKTVRHLDGRVLAFEIPGYGKIHTGSEQVLPGQGFRPGADMVLEFQVNYPSNGYLDRVRDQLLPLLQENGPVDFDTNAIPVQIHEFDQDNNTDDDAHAGPECRTQ